MKKKSSKNHYALAASLVLFSCLCFFAPSALSAVTMQTGDETTLHIGNDDEEETRIQSDQKGHSMRVVSPKQEDFTDYPSSVIITPEVYWNGMESQVRPPRPPHPPLKPRPSRPHPSKPATRPTSRPTSRYGDKGTSPSFSSPTQPTTPAPVAPSAPSTPSTPHQPAPSKAHQPPAMNR